MSDPKILLRQIHDQLAAVEPQVQIIRPKGPHRERLADAVEAAIGHAALGTEAGCEAAIADLAGAAGVVAEFRDDPRYPNARAVARVADEALPGLRAIRWSPGLTFPLYPPAAVWNVPVAALPRHPAEAQLCDLLWDKGSAVGPGRWDLTLSDYSWSVYDVRDATTTVRVQARHRNWGNLDGQPIPWDPAWRPSGGWWQGREDYDCDVLLLDGDTGAEISLWQVDQPNQDGVLRVGSGSRIATPIWDDAAGVARGVRGSDLRCSACLVLAAELASGVIRHALAMPCCAEAPEFVPPAAKSDGLTRPGVPAGTRFSLAATDGEIASLAPWLRPVVTALRDYGWFVTDGSGGFDPGGRLRSGTSHWQLEDWNSGGPLYLRAGIASPDAARHALHGLLSRDRLGCYAPPPYPAP
jgi:hypothetical protein